MHDICGGFATIEQLLWRQVEPILFVSYLYNRMVSHDTFKNIVLFSVVVAFLYFLFRDRIDVLTEGMETQHAVVDVPNIIEKNKSGAMTAENTGIDRSLIKSDEEIGILSTCQQISGGDLVKTCSEYTGFKFDYDRSLDKYLRQTSFDQPNFLKSNGL
jgi:hypothetical protein